MEVYDTYQSDVLEIVKTSIFTQTFSRGSILGQNVSLPVIF